MEFTFEYIVAKHGWAECTLQCRGEHYEFRSISYLSDAFAELSESIFDILNGPYDSECRFLHEPGQTVLQFASEEGNVKIQVYEFENGPEDGPCDKGVNVESFLVRKSRLKSQYLETTGRILTELGASGYEQRWGYAFPLAIYNKIKAIGG